MGGTLTLQHNEIGWFEYVTSVKGKSWLVEGCWSTLLGPEGPGYRIGGRRFFWTSVNRTEAFGLVWLGEYRPYFENYTVDASILNLNLSRFGLQRSKHTHFGVCG